MLKYAKKLLNEKIEEDTKKYNKYQDEKDSFIDKLANISNLEYYRTELKVSKFWLVFSICALISSLGIMLTIGANVLFVAASLLSLTKIYQYKQIKKEIERILNSDYQDYVNLTSDELYQFKTKLTIDKEKIESDINEIKNSIDKNIDRLNMLYKDDLKKCSSKDIDFCTRNSKNHEELTNIKKQICNSLLENYLNEKINYSDINFNNKLEENNKKLIKKM